MRIEDLHREDIVVVEGWAGTFRVADLNPAEGMVLVDANDILGDWILASRVVYIAAPSPWRTEP